MTDGTAPGGTAMEDAPLLRTDGARLWSDLMTLGAIGNTSRGGSFRPALSDADREARHLFAHWAAEAAPTVTVDRMGNMFARREGADPSLPPVMVGSHLDTQMPGGRFDGPPGLLAGLEAVRALDRAGMRTRRAMEVVNWTDEEGARFSPGIVGSAVFTGRVELSAVLAGRDRAGATFGDELARIGFAGTAPVGGRPVDSYLELHIEQRPLLEEAGLTVGAVSGTSFTGGALVTVLGENSHSQTTPMSRRHNALAGAPRVVAETERIGAAQEPEGLASATTLDTWPNNRVNVPHRAEVGFLAVHATRAGRDGVMAAVARTGREMGLDATVVRSPERDRLEFPEEMVALTEQVAAAPSHGSMRLPTLTGHDAINMHWLCPTALVFVPCRAVAQRAGVVHAGACHRGRGRAGEHAAPTRGTVTPTHPRRSPSSRSEGLFPPVVMAVPAGSSDGTSLANSIPTAARGRSITLLSEQNRGRIAAAVDAAFDQQIDVTRQLSAIPSTRGAEGPAQDLMVDLLRTRGYTVDDWTIRMEDLQNLPDCGVILHDFSRARTVVGTLRPENETGRSLILQGHCDVVPAGPAEMWTTPPFSPTIRDGWMYGRGTGDMKAGTIAALFAVDAVHAAGLALRGRVHFQSVIEEESTGVGALSTLQRGYRADCALLPEPSGGRLSDVCVGVIWFRLKVRGIPVHVARATEGSNAIKAAYRLITALEGLEAEWNTRARGDAHYGDMNHPINFNPGIIQGGDWASSVPAWCDIDCRISVLPGWDVDAARDEITACVAEAARGDSFMANSPPEVVWSGYLSRGYVLADTKGAAEASSVMRDVHTSLTGQALESRAGTGLNDARFYSLFYGIPAFCYGPRCEMAHGFDERVEIKSIRDTTVAIACFVAEWCGCDEA